jgi:hypothetical protein
MAQRCQEGEKRPFFILDTYFSGTRDQKLQVEMKAAAALVVAVVVLLVIGFFVPLFPQSTMKNYIVSSGSVTVYESFGLQLLNCGGYYYSARGTSLGQSQSSSGYGVHCNFGGTT